MTFQKFGDESLLRIVRSMSDADMVEIALRLADMYPTLFIEIANSPQGMVVSLLNGESIHLTRADYDHLQTFQEYQKVEAVRWLRERFNPLSLRSAIDLIDVMVERSIIRHRDWNRSRPTNVFGQPVYSEEE